MLGQEKTDAEKVVKQASERVEKAEKELSYLKVYTGSIVLDSDFTFLLQKFDIKIFL